MTAPDQEALEALAVKGSQGVRAGSRASHHAPAGHGHSASIPDACNVPPEGWRCTRTPGHDGPCAAHPDPIVGHKTLYDGTRVPLRQREAEAIFARAEAEDARRKAAMPDEQTAIRQLFDAQLRLKELGWQDPIYAPKDGSDLDIIELGSIGIHRGKYEGQWPNGGWWIWDGDSWPSRPALARAAQGIAARSDETPAAAQPDGQEPGPQDAPEPREDHPHG